MCLVNASAHFNMAFKVRKLFLHLKIKFEGAVILVLNLPPPCKCYFQIVPEVSVPIQILSAMCVVEIELALAL